MTTAELVGRLSGVKKERGRGFVAHCPAHDDHRPSLAVTTGNSGAVLLTCRAGCSTEDVLARMGLELSDLYPEKLRGSAIVETYDYVDEDGVILYQGVRLEPKSFRQRRPDGVGGWDWRLGDSRRVLYRLPDLIEGISLGKTVYVVEGEKDVHALEGIGALATTNPMGAGKWRPEYSETLQDAIVRIVADNDEPGRKHARDVAKALDGIAESVELVQAKVGKDASDHIEAGYGLDDFVPLAEEAEEAEEDTGTKFVTLAELMANPEMLKPPHCDVPRLGYRGRLSILAAPDKAGKSTLLAHAAAALSQGEPFLGEPTEAGRVVWCGLEEATGDAVRRFMDLGARAENVSLVTGAGPDLLKKLERELEASPRRLLVIDSLQEYARVMLGEAPGDGDNAGWAKVVRPPVDLARKHNVAIVILHHTRRSDGKARGAGEIMAAVDLLLEMSVDSGDQYMRHIRGRGRWDCEAFSVALQDDGYELAGGSTLSADDQVMLHIRQSPDGLSQTRLEGLVRATRSAVRAAVGRREGAGQIKKQGSGRSTVWVINEQEEIGL